MKQVTRCTRGGSIGPPYLESNAHRRGRKWPEPKRIPSAPRACTGSASKRPGGTRRRGWARLLLDRARDIITHGPVHRGANGAAMPTDEDDQDGHFFFNHPERGGGYTATKAHAATATAV